MSSSWWTPQTKRMKTLIIIGASVFSLLIVATVVSLVLAMNGSKISTGETRPQTKTEQSKESTEKEPAPEEAVQSGKYTFEVDGTGMAVMPVTTDPAEAAAGAAAVKFNVDTTKYTAVEFVEEAAQRMTHPSDKYVGPDLSVETGMRQPFDVDTSEIGIYTSAKQCLQSTSEVCTLWPMLSNGNFDTYRSEGITVSGTPTLVLSESEMREWYPYGAFSTNDINVSSGSVPKTEGAALTWWVVVSDVQDRLVDENASQEIASVIGIWCDPPAEGGLCGVASNSVFGKMPESWPHRSQ